MAARLASHQKAAEFGEHGIEAADGIGQTGGHGIHAEIDAGLGRPHGIGIELAHHGDVVDKHGVQAIDFRL